MKSLALLTPIDDKASLAFIQASPNPSPNGNNTMRHYDKRDDFDYTPLVSKDSPQYKEIHYSDKWNSHWIMAPVGSLAYTQKDKLQKVFKDIGDGKGEAGKVTNKAEYHLYNAQGEETTIQVDQSGISDHADYTSKDDGLWWFAGLEAAALKMRGYFGLDHDKITWGDPVKAFKMLTNEKATFEAVKDKDQLKKIFKRSKDIPVIMGTGQHSDDQLSLSTWSWYTILEYTGQGLENSNDKVITDG
ncbi:hypothetical protein V865_000598 [Kwoniella europaea PYCC6329]|uniref:Uncharacterized protein n=1 Tax=Kwoniella europaea PYCC6329 TaxID=1423913 RepID=A0AAX4KAN1_9TREE